MTPWVHNSGYGSDGGYKSDSAPSKKSASRSRWRRKDSPTPANGNAAEREESDGGYLSEAVATGKNSKEKGKSKKEKTRGKREVTAIEPSSADNGDPDTLLSKINASLAHSSTNSPSSPVNTSFPSSGLSQPDGYTTDSATSRGRSTDASSKKSKKAKAQTEGADVDPMRAPKKSFFRMVSRSVSRDRDKDRRNRARDSPTPPPVPPVPTILPIAERFARSETATPIGNADSKAVSGDGSSSIDGQRAPSPLTPALSVSSFVDVGRLRSESPANFSPRSEASGNAALLAPTMGSVRPSRLSLNYPEMKSAPNGKALDPSSARSLDMPRVYVEDTDEKPSSLGSRSVDSKGDAKANDAVLSQSSAGDVKDKDREKKIRKGLGIFAATGALFSQNKAPSAPVSAPPISAPNAHLFSDTRPVDAKDIADVLNAKRMGSPSSPGSEDIVRTSPQSHPSSSPLSTPAAGDSSESDSYFHYNSHPYSSSSLASTPPGSMDSAKVVGTAAASGTIASRRAAPMRTAPIPLVIDVTADDEEKRKGSTTPTQSRSDNQMLELPNDHSEEPGSLPTSPQASVLAYYNVPPPSPPPTGPLPPPPPGQPATPGSRPESSLSPSRAFAHASRSPSPLRSISPPVGMVSLGLPNGSLSRSPSPSVQAQMNVRRGKQSPFPTRPILPQQNSRELVERVEQNKIMYVNGTPRQAPGEGEWGENDDWRDAEVEDAYVYADVEYEYDGRDETRTSTYIRAARARGEKRVYFVSPPQSADTDGTFLDSSPLNDESHVRIEMAPVVEEEEEQVAPIPTHEDASHLRPRPARASSVEGDRRSISTASVYSRYSVLDEEGSAQTREGFVKRVQEWEKEDYPEVPQIPDEFRQAAAEKKPANDTFGWRAQLKPTSSRFR